MKRQGPQTSMEICSLSQGDKRGERMGKKETDKVQHLSEWLIQVLLVVVLQGQRFCRFVLLESLL